MFAGLTFPILTWVDRSNRFQKIVVFTSRTEQQMLRPSEDCIVWDLRHRQQHRLRALKVILERFNLGRNQM